MFFYGRAGRLTYKNGGLRPGQWVDKLGNGVLHDLAAGNTYLQKRWKKQRAPGPPYSIGGSPIKHKLTKDHLKTAKLLLKRSGPSRGVYAALVFYLVNLLSVAFLCGRAGRLTAKNGGCRPGQWLGPKAGEPRRCD